MELQKGITNQSQSTPKGNQEGMADFKGSIINKDHFNSLISINNPNAA